MTSGTSEPTGEPVDVWQSGLDALLRPKSLVVIGMSLKSGSPSHMVLRNLEANDFSGHIHLVGRNAGKVNGRTCHASLFDAPCGIDLAVVITPAAAVADTLRECVAHGVKSAVCFASGFAETGEAGRAAQAEIEGIARDGGLALLGPNTVGYFNYLAPLLVSMVEGGQIAPVTVDRGPAVGIIAQSGGIGIHIAETLAARRVPVAYNMTTGNEAVIGLSDFVRFFADDPRVGAVAIYAEQIRKPSALMEAVGYALSRDKPVVMFHPGRSARAQAAAASHTGALAGDYPTMRAIASAGGILMTDSLEEVIDLAEVLLRYPEPVSGDLAVITGSGAICSIAEDMCQQSGVAMAPLDATRSDILRALLPAYLEPRNPLDLGTAVGFQPELVGQALAAVLDDTTVGSVMLSFPFVRSPLDEAWMTGIAHAAANSRTPVVYVIHDEGVPLREEVAAMAAEHRVVIHRSPERAIRALARLSQYGAARSALPAADDDLVLPDLPDLPWGSVAEWQGKAILARAGVAVPRGRLVGNADEAVAAAEEIGFPVVMKAQATRLAHKSEAGGVLLAIGDADAVRQGYDTLHANVGRYDPSIALDGILVEGMGARGVEIVVGARRDPQWGTVVMVGMGGVWVEALGDIRLLSPELDRAGIVGELRRLKGARLFDGYRGSPPADLDAVAGVVQRVAALMQARPDIRELEINPLIACGDAATALDVLIVTAGEKATSA